jgi:O-antigen/teichoic acid export membrane protein
MQRKERMDFVSKSMMIRELSGLLIFTVLLIIFKSLFVSLVGYAFVISIIVLKYDLVGSLELENDNNHQTSKNYFSSLLTNWEWKTLKKIVTLSLPLGVGVSLGSLVSNIPRYLVNHYLGQEILGYFAAIVYFINGFSTLFNAIGQATRPRLAINYEDNFKSYITLLVKLIIISTIFGLLFIMISLIFGKEILRIMYSTNYSHYSNILIMISISVFFQAITSILQIAIQSARVFKIQVIISIISLVTAFLSGIFLIPKYGIQGAGLTVLFYSVINTLTVALFFFMFVYMKIKNMVGDKYTKGRL